MSTLKFFNGIIDLYMVQVFPNMYIAYQLLLTIPIANYKTARSFSALKSIKNMYLSTMVHEYCLDWGSKGRQKKIFYYIIEEDKLLLQLYMYILKMEVILRKKIW